MPVGSAALTRAIQKLGSWYAINIGSETFNSFGDGSVTFTTFSGEGYVFESNATDISSVYGVYPDADAIGFFSMDRILPTGSKIRITHRGVDFDALGEPIVPPFSGQDLLQIISLKKTVL